MRPTKINRPTPAMLAIEWDDGHKSRHTLAVVRKYCPCAGCKVEMETNEGSSLLPIIKQGQNELQAIEPVGSYALQFIWKDGHRTGIYTFEYLRRLCECEECRGVVKE